MKPIVILYHADCPDGFSGAWAAYKKFGDSAEYIPVHHDAPPPNGLKDRVIYMVDFTYPAGLMEEIIRNNKRVTALDHHITREKEVKMTEDSRYSVDNSGAVLAWRYFHPDKPTPLLLQYVEDQDIWKFSLPDTKAISAALDSFKHDFSVWDKLVEDIEDDNIRKDMVAKGSNVLNYERQLAQRLIEENAISVELDGHSAHVINAPHELASLIGSMLFDQGFHFLISWIEEKDGIHVSLRSDGSIDVSRIALKHGGGGHKGAAGFSLSKLESFPWKHKND